jgi:excisionase family DNA binding protein
MGIKDEYVTISEAARLLDVTRQTVSRWIKERKFNTQKVGREILIRKDELRKFQGQRVSGSYGEAVIKLILGVYTDYCWAKSYITLQERVGDVYPGKDRVKVVVNDQNGNTRVIELTPKENKNVLTYIEPRLKVLLEEVYHVGRETGRRFGIFERNINKSADNSKDK